MPDNVSVTPGSGASIATDEIAGAHHQRVKVTLGADGVSDGDVSATNPLPITGALTDAQLRATPVPVSGTVTITDGSGPVTVDGVVSISGGVAVSGPLTDTQLRATPVPVSGTVTITDGSGPVTVDGTVGVSGTVAVSGPLTDVQLRATPVPVSGTVTITDGSGPVTVDGTVGVSGTVAVSGPLTDTQLRAAAVPVSGPLTDTQLRATPVPVSGTVTITDGSGPVTVDGTVTVTGVATETTLAALNTKTPALGQAAMAASSPVVIASDQAAVPVNQAGVSATGSLAAANATVALSLAGATGFALDVRGTFVATIVVEGTVDGTNWITLSVVPIGAALNVAQVASVSAVGAWWGNANGLQQVRARASAYTSGSATIVLRAMQAAGLVFAVPTGQTAVAVSGTVNPSGGALAAGTNAIGDVGVQVRANATGAASVANVLSPATPAGQVIKGSAGRLLGGTLVNTNAAVRFLKVFNATTITPGTTSATFEIALPPNVPVQIDTPEAGLAFATGIVVMIAAAQGLTNNGAVTGNEVTGFLAFA